MKRYATQKSIYYEQNSFRDLPDDWRHFKAHTVPALRDGHA